MRTTTLLAPSSQDIGGDIDHLPALPTIVGKARALIDSRSVRTEQLAALLLLDPGLTARTFALAGAALRPRPLSLADAIDAVGVDALRALLSRMPAASDDLLPNYAVDAEQFQHHALVCGLSAGLIAAASGQVESDAAYLAGLLHDIAKPLIDRRLRADFHRIPGVVSRNRLSLVEAERAIIGADHAEIGALMVERWQLPAVLVDGVRYHHEPWHPAATPLARIVHVANMVEFQHTTGAATWDDVAAQDVVGCLGLTSRDLRTLSRRLDMALATIETSIRA
jgi:putative nucleotidyltransferase with HDIG domain